MCWCITGSNYDVDIEFEDDLTMGEKVRLSEKVQFALKDMECPFSVAAIQIQGLDYNRCLPVIQWLIKKLMESRDVRAIINRKQGLLNYNRLFKRKEEPNPEVTEQSEINSQASTVNLSNAKGTIFNCKPRRLFKTNANIEEISYHDPKRVHQALREFGDQSANQVFEHMLEQIQAIEKENTAQGAIGTLHFGTIGGK